MRKLFGHVHMTERGKFVVCVVFDLVNFQINRKFIISIFHLIDIYILKKHRRIVSPTCSNLGQVW